MEEEEIRQHMLYSLKRAEQPTINFALEMAVAHEGLASTLPFKVAVDHLKISDQYFERAFELEQLLLGKVSCIPAIFYGPGLGTFTEGLLYVNNTQNPTMSLAETLTPDS